MKKKTLIFLILIVVLSLTLISCSKTIDYSVKKGELAGKRNDEIGYKGIDVMERTVYLCVDSNVIGSYKTPSSIWLHLPNEEQIESIPGYKSDYQWFTDPSFENPAKFDGTMFIYSDTFVLYTKTRYTINCKYVGEKDKLTDACDPYEVAYDAGLKTPDQMGIAIEAEWYTDIKLTKSVQDPNLAKETFLPNTTIYAKAP